jgi:hypothetical protein
MNSHIKALGALSCLEKRKEALEYSQGTFVELCAEPGQVYLIKEYNPDNPAPIVLSGYPVPCCPHELKILSAQEAVEKLIAA